MELLITFIIFNILNVIVQTAKSIATVKCGKVVAAVVNAVAYGLYTYIVILTMCELDTWLKALIVALCNLVGVFVVKWAEEKSQKTKLWKVEVTIPSKFTSAVHFDLKDVPHNYIENVGKYSIFNFYCATKSESKKVKDITSQYNAKYFVAETKVL